ncbi:unnamed protein product [Paramecium octaurelia]|uniref:Uncharacterized protein n=1 Tax=Paramecium octaurelia TaxID=43137 RepID=A0A8S1VYH6_PAROT|nr:unnamed protein product [Paramecium octaurelia]
MSELSVLQEGQAEYNTQIQQINGLPSQQVQEQLYLGKVLILWGNENIYIRLKLHKVGILSYQYLQV